MKKASSMLDKKFKKISKGVMVCAVSSLSLASCVSNPMVGVGGGNSLSSSQGNSSVKLSMMTAIALSNVNVRADAGTEHSKVYALKKDQRVEILSEKDNWYQIKNPSDTSKPVGWVRYDFLVVDVVPAQTRQAEVAKDVKMRSGPGTSHKVVTIAKAGSNLVVNGIDGRWYKVVAGDKEGWIRNDFVVVNSEEGSVNVASTPVRATSKPAASDDTPTSFAGFLNGMTNKLNGTSSSAGSEQVNKLTTAAVAGPVMPLERRVDYAGYSADFQSIKKEMMSGDLDGAYEELKKRDKELVEGAKTTKEFAEEADLLTLMEYGSLSLDKGDTDTARDYLTYAEDALKERDQRSQTADLANSGLSNLASVAGFGELGEYTPQSFERILLLNYKSVAYLLEGKREAFNVAQRAIDLQNEERKIFEKQIAEAKSDLDSKKSSGFVDASVFDIVGKVFDGFNKEDVKKANIVKDAFVNPFGDYVAGMIYELDGYRDRDMLSNALISYKKASELNPSASFLKKAVSDMESRKIARGEHKIVHIVIADGIAPARKTMTYGLPLPTGVIPIKVPVYVSEENKVGKVTVSVKGRGGSLNLEDLANVEAIALRHDVDSRPLKDLTTLVNVVRTVAEKKVASGFGFIGEIISNVRESVSNPNMRAWMTLPSSFKANRLIVPASAKEITVSTYSKSGKRLTSETVSLTNEGPSIIYGRSLNGTLTLQSSAKTWVVN
ncbi:SH3 domain-containing protein [Terasakiella sp.]|uniref:SH3 domain-containing protein n=1 Tax=Terasakiella sp. TaxID=2034861 RepID=UPI003AA9D5D0